MTANGSAAGLDDTETGERLTVSVPEAGRLLGIGRGLAYELARSGELPVLKLGRRLVVPRAQLLALLSAPRRPRTDERAQGD